MSHACTRSKYAAEKTFERNSMTYYKKFPFFIPVKNFLLNKISHTYLYIVLAFSPWRTEKGIFTFQSMPDFRCINLRS